MKKQLIAPLFCMVLVLAALLINGKAEPPAAMEEPSPTEGSGFVEEPVSTGQPSSEYYLEGYQITEIYDYFCEVALSSEYFYGDGNAAAIQKWAEPIYYSISGECTDQDLAVIENFAAEINRIYGFPGMYPANDEGSANLKLFFLEPEEFRLAAERVVAGEDSHGIANWHFFNESNEIYACEIYHRTDIEQHVRNSVILEEFVNGFGLGNDTALRTDSIIYAYYSEPQSLSEMDWLLLRLLYHPDMKCGLEELECRKVITNLIF